MRNNHQSITEHYFCNLYNRQQHAQFPEADPPAHADTRMHSFVIRLKHHHIFWTKQDTASWRIWGTMLLAYLKSENRKWQGPRSQHSNGQRCFRKNDWHIKNLLFRLQKTGKRHKVYETIKRKIKWSQNYLPRPTLLPSKHIRQTVVRESFIWGLHD